MKEVFLDTNYIIALENIAEQNHHRAVEHWLQFDKRYTMLVTTSFVFDEVVTFLNSRNQHNTAVRIGNTLLNSNSILFIHINEELFRKGWQYFQKHTDKTYSLTDCISFLVMKQREILSALTFDKHFQQAGFEILP
jgi:predicted nucleic acid-binding protein